MFFFSVYLKKEKNFLLVYYRLQPNGRDITPDPPHDCGASNIYKKVNQCNERYVYVLPDCG
jgi:hypothetical protein